MDIMGIWMMFETLQAMLSGDVWNDIAYPAQNAIKCSQLVTELRDSAHEASTERPWSTLANVQVGWDVTIIKSQATWSQLDGQRLEIHNYWAQHERFCVSQLLSPLVRDN
jgi:hypothetical protein